MRSVEGLMKLKWNVEFDRSAKFQTISKYIVIFCFNKITDVVSLSKLCQLESNLSQV
jgi:hypothetical protein